jgi:hypothetical protein
MVVSSRISIWSIGGLSGRVEVEMGVFPLFWISVCFCISKAFLKKIEIFLNFFFALN